MKRIIILLAITTLALATLTGCGSDKKEGTDGMSITAIDGGYIGTSTCLGCHDGSVAQDRRSFMQSGHPYKYTHTGGAVMGSNTIAGLWSRPQFTTDYINTRTLNDLKVSGDGTPPLLDWSSINYVVGGFGWKIRWGLKDTLMSGGTTSTGYVWSGPRAQFNLFGTSDASGALEKWSAYNNNVDKLYECAICHNTNGIVSTEGYFCRTDGGTDAAPTRTQPWAKNPGMGPERHGGYESSWTFDGVQCEACHGPGQNHATTNGKLGVLELPGGIEICAKCHIRAENNNDTFPATGLRSAECGGDSSVKVLTYGATANASTGFLGHHEQYNEMVGFQGDGVHAGLKCVTCHDPHKRSIKIHSVVKGFLETTLGVTIANPDQPEDGAIKVGCVATGCHGPKPVKAAFQGKHAGVTCVDCHMAEATKSAINSSTAGWGRKGDIKTHIFKINPTGTTITRTNVDGKTVATNYITPRYACGRCHDANIGSAPPLISGLTSTATEAEKEAAFQAAATGYHTP